MSVGKSGSLGMDDTRRISSVDKMDDYSAGLQYYWREKGSLSHSQQESARQGA